MSIVPGDSLGFTLEESRAMTAQRDGSPDGSTVTTAPERNGASWTV